MVSLERFKSLDKPEYENNEGRIADVTNLNHAMDEITQTCTSDELIDLFNSITVPISKINSIPEVMEDPLVKRRLLSAVDPISGVRIRMPPPPNMTAFLEESSREMTFPPRFGEDNKAIYGGVLGYSDEQLGRLKEKEVI
jgi:formyl-CoA transferase